MQSTIFNQSFQLLRAVRQPFTLQVQSLLFYSNLTYLSIWLPMPNFGSLSRDALTPPTDGHQEPRNEVGPIVSTSQEIEEKKLDFVEV